MPDLSGAVDVRDVLHQQVAGSYLDVETFVAKPLEVRATTYQSL
jgi:hypothetical protein